MRSESTILRRALALAVTGALALGVIPAPALAAARPPAIKAVSASIQTIDGFTGWSQKPTSRRRVASTIKLLNALVIRDHVSLDTTVTVPRKAAAMWCGDIGLVRGQVVSYRKLLQMMLVASANDAAETAAIRIAGSEEAYVGLMNAKARELGLTGTVAIDPHGLSEKERSTAFDLSVLARRVLADPALRSIVGKRSVTVRFPNGTKRTVKSTNLLLGVYPGIEGVKTGYTSSAGYCFVGAAERDGVELVGVVLDCSSLARRFSQMRKLLDWGFAHCHLRTVVSRDETMGTVPVDGAPASPGVTVHAETTATVALFDDDTSVTTSVALPPSVTAPVIAGQRLGTVTVRRGTAVIASVPLVADVGVGAPSLVPVEFLRRLFTGRG